MSISVEIKNLNKVYKDGKRALNGINLTINTGDFFALIGANGAGKTTIIKILTDLSNQDNGLVKIFGKNIANNFTEIKKEIGVVPQEFNINIFGNILEIVVNQAGYFGISRSKAVKDAEQILKKLHLWDKRKNIFKQLSGGMKRRLMIARALIHHPKLLILDEPTAGVDVEIRQDTWNYLKKLNKEGMTILLTTHYLEEVEKLCNRMAIISDGKIVKNGFVAEILDKIVVNEYIFDVKNMPENLEKLNCSAQKIDKKMIKIIIPTGKNLSNILEKFSQEKIIITAIRSENNRLDQLFFSTLKTIIND